MILKLMQIISFLKQSGAIKIVLLFTALIHCIIKYLIFVEKKNVQNFNIWKVVF